MNEDEMEKSESTDENEIEGPPGPTSERWDPLGAADSNEDSDNIDHQSHLVHSHNNPHNHHHHRHHQGIISTFDNDIGYYVCSNNGGAVVTVPPSAIDSSQIKRLEEEQEILTTSLMALTSHFAQVQFRLRQIVDAPITERDQLLKNLEEFAFRGIPEIAGNLESSESVEVITNLERAQQKQFDLIERLKRQLTELENFAYESGAPVLPQSILLEKQKIIIDELKNKLNLNVDESDLPQLSSEDLKNHVETAIGEFVGPLKMKEQLVAQLKTQITDLERFIAFLQCDSEETKFKTAQDQDYLDRTNTEAYNTYVMKKKKANNIAAAASMTAANNMTSCKYKENSKQQQQQQMLSDNDDNNKNNSNNDRFTRINLSSSTTSTVTAAAATTTTNESGGVSQSLNSKAHSLLDKASTLLQMFAVTQFSCGSNRSTKKNTLKKTSKIKHWGDTRAQLEVDIQEVISLAMALKRDREKLSETKTTGVADKEQVVIDSYYDYSNDSDDCGISGGGTYLGGGGGKIHHHGSLSSPTSYSSIPPEAFSLTNVELTSVVRKNFAVTLQKLIQHGLRSVSDVTTSLVPFMGCLNPSGGGGGGIQQQNNSNREYYYHNHSYHHHHHHHHNFNNMEGTGSSSSDEEDFFGGFSTGYRQMHAWELILEYYNIKNGDQYNETPARKLSQSFNLDIVGENAISNKQSLLSAIGSIITIHSPYKRSYNSHFKAFVCAGLNAHKLVQWLNLIFQCTELVNTYYTSWSYVARTGFRDALRSIDRLTKYDFDLPVDLAVRQFQNIKDVFM